MNSKLNMVIAPSKPHVSVKGSSMKRFFYLFLPIVLFLSSLSTVYSEEGVATITKVSLVETNPAFTELRVEITERREPRGFYFGGPRPRLIFDFDTTHYTTPNTIEFGQGDPIEKARLGLHHKPLKTRMVFDIGGNEEKPKWDIQYYTDYIIIRISWAQSRIEDENDEIEKKIILSTAGTLSKRVVATTYNETEIPVDPAGQEPPQRSGLQDKQVEIEIVAEEKTQLPQRSTSPKDLNKATPPSVEIEALHHGERALGLPPNHKRQPEKQQDKDAQEAPIFLQDISFTVEQGGDVVSFYLDDFITPYVSAVENERLMVLCEFTGVVLGQDVQREQLVQGTYVEEMKVSANPVSQRVRVILYLRDNYAYDLEQTYYKNANIFALAVSGNELPE